MSQSQQTLVTVVSTLFASTVIQALLGYLGDRRKSRPQVAVDEQTVDVRVDAARLAGFGARIDSINRAHQTEVESLNHTIDNLKRGLADALERVERLEERVSAADARYREAVRYVRSLRGLLARAEPQLEVPPVPSLLEADLDY